MGAERKHFPEPETKIGPYRTGTIPHPELLRGQSLYHCWIETLREIGLYETMIVHHFQTHKQAVAAVNYAGGALFARFKTTPGENSKIIVWRYE